MRILLSLLILLQINLLKAQAPDILWSRSYGNLAYDWGKGVCQMYDGNFIAAGGTQDTSTHDVNAWIFVTDQFGNLLWQKDFGENSRAEIFNCMRNSPDNGFVLCGDAERTDGYTAIYVKKLDSNGTSIAGNRFGNPDKHYHGYCVDAFPNGDVIVAGRIDNNFIFFRTFPNLNLMYGNVGDWSWTDIAYGISKTYDGGYVVVGTTSSWGGHSNNIFVLKMSADGYYQNYNILGTSGEEDGYWIEQTSDSCYILCGSTTYLSENSDIYIIKIDQNLDFVWTRRYGFDYHDKGIKIIENAEGGYTCIATVGKNSFDIYVLRLDEYGDTLWTKLLGSPNLDEVATSIARTADGGYIISGNQQITWSNVNAYLVRLAREPYRISVYHRYGLELELQDGGNTNDMLEIDPGPELNKILSSNNLVRVTVVLDTIIHPHVSDLTLLLSHEGITDTLFYQAGGEGADIINCNLSDSSAQIIDESEAPFTGTFKPHSPLSVFNGVDPIGEWTLSVHDGVEGNTGTLQAWGLKLFFDNATTIECPEPVIPKEYTLYQNYPNPFNPSTIIKYEIPSVGTSHDLSVQLRVYDILGREVATLVNQQQKPGYYEVTWNAANQSSGVYFYRLSTSNFVETKKMILLR